MRRMKRNRQETAELISELSSIILDQEKEIKEIMLEISAGKNTHMDLTIKLMGAQTAEAHLRGYVQRVRETDGGEQYSVEMDLKDNPI